MKEQTDMTYDADIIYNQLKGYFQERIRRNEPLAWHTSLGVGGPADLWIQLSSAQELASLVRLCAEEQVPLLLIGSGHNTLFTDTGVRGIVAHMMASPVVQEKAGDGTVPALVDAGSRWSDLEQQGYVCRWGARLDQATTLGGSVASLDGGVLSGLAHHVRWVEVLDARGCNAEDGERAAIPQVRRYPLDVLDLQGHFVRSRSQQGVHFDAIGHLVAPPRGLIEPAEILVRMAIALPREALPSQMQCEQNASEAQTTPPLRLGPLFRDPGTESAACLIEHVGLAGFIVGNVQIAPQDANMLLNLGGAQASDALTLIEVIHRTVLEQLGIDLALALNVYGERLPAEALPAPAWTAPPLPVG
jgi:UDP-N-acetylmuramate dehydrogenase